MAEAASTVVDLDGQVAIVTGAARGIGAGIAATLAAAGARVARLDKDFVEDGPAVDPDRDLKLIADVTDEAQVGDAVAAVLERWGRIDVLVNNAGYAPTEPVEEITGARWREIVDVNLGGAFYFSSAVLPAMTAQGAGRIINIGSQLGLTGAAQLSHYAAAKAGLHGLTKSLARELAPRGILVNAVAPGPVETEGLAHADAEVLENTRRQIPLGRFATVEEIAPTVLLLASAGGSFYTGSILNVSGGHVM